MSQPWRRKDRYGLYTITQAPFEYFGSGTIICAHFGCRNQLSLPEQMAGKYCQRHDGTRVDIMDVLKLP